jgi:predicted nucleic acid-binding Zn ribbon protein
MTNKICQECGKSITGRLDKKFCDDYCRNSFNNKVARKSEKWITEINRILRKNRSILKTLNPEGLTSVKKEYLSLQSFNFNYFTHLYTTKEGNVYRFCYEYGYRLTENDAKVLIVNWQNYMAKEKL